MSETILIVCTSICVVCAVTSIWAYIATERFCNRIIDAASVSKEVMKFPSFTIWEYRSKRSAVEAEKALPAKQAESQKGNNS